MTHEALTRFLTHSLNSDMIASISVLGGTDHCVYVPFLLLCNLCQ
jgi:hypothetical protein